MKKSVVALASLFGITFFFWVLGFYIPEQPTITKVFYSLATITVLHALFKLIFEETIVQNLTNKRTRYSFRKAVSVIFVIITLIALTRYWVKNPENLLVAYGLLGAGIAVAMQDFFKNFVGGITLFATSPYQVGDRVTIHEHFGDVIDIGMFYTTLLELRGWVDGDQTTGRICMIPNGHTLMHAVHNFTKDHNFIFDEIMIPITHDSDWKKASEIMRKVATKLTKNASIKASEQFDALHEKFYLESRMTDPTTYIKITDNWIQLHLRYVTEVHERRALNSAIYELILDEFKNKRNINLASQTLKLIK